MLFHIDKYGQCISSLSHKKCCQNIPETWRQSLCSSEGATKLQYQIPTLAPSRQRGGLISIDYVSI